jgi:sugar phosphate permease
MASGKSLVSGTSHVRWGVLLLICLMYLITFMDRANISVAATFIQSEFSLTKAQMGVAFSVFLWSYSLGQIPGGWLGDKFGPRKVLGLMVLFWSLMTMSTGLASGFASLVAVRFVFGLGEAGAFPTATRAMQTWFPRVERGFVQGLTHGFARFGIAIVPPVATALIVAFGWRSVFYVFGGVGLVWSMVFMLTYRDRPEQHPKVRPDELMLIRDGRPDGAHQKVHATVPWRLILRNPTVWHASIAWGCYNYCIFFFLTWFPTYLLEHLHVSVKSMGMLASLPLMAGVIGDILGGVITDKVLKHTSRLRFARAVVAAPAMVLSGAALVAAAQTVDPFTSIVWLAVSLFCLELVIGPAWALTMDIGGEHSGTVSGIVGMTGNLFGSASPIIFGLLTQRGDWTAPFYLSAAVMTLGAVLWTFFIRPRDESQHERLRKSGDQAGRQELTS